MPTPTSLAEAVTDRLRKLPPAQQQEVLDFAEFLSRKQQRGEQQRSEQQKPRSSIWEKIKTRIQEVPEEAWKDVPADGAVQHDHYIYGTPKRKT